MGAIGGVGSWCLSVGYLSGDALDTSGEMWLDACLDGPLVGFCVGELVGIFVGRLLDFARVPTREMKSEAWWASQLENPWVFPH
jgi:hypothetical protein